MIPLIFIFLLFEYLITKDNKRLLALHPTYWLIALTSLVRRSAGVSLTQHQFSGKISRTWKRTRCRFRFFNEYLFSKTWFVSFVPFFIVFLCITILAWLNWRPFLLTFLHLIFVEENHEQALNYRPLRTSGVCLRWQLDFLTFNYDETAVSKRWFKLLK